MLMLFSLATAGPAFDLLKLRDDVSCETLGAATPALRDELIVLTAPDQLPSAVPMRAVGCLAELYAEDTLVQAAFLSWIADPSRAGEALLLLGRAERLPVSLQTHLITTGLHAQSDRVRARAEKLVLGSTDPAIKALF